MAASDVLYERPMAALIARAFAAALAPGGLGLLSDPGRRTAESLADACAAVGLAARCVERVPAADAGAELTVSVFEIRRISSAV